MNPTSLILFLIGSTILVISLLPKTGNFLDVRSIFTEHFLIFKGNLLQMVSIFFVPFLFSIAILKTRCIDEEILDNLNIVLSILIAMFLSILSILCAFADKDRNEPIYRQLLKETFNSTIFEIILCLFLLLISFIALFIKDSCQTQYLQVISGSIYYLTIVVILNILVIIKRIKALFDNK